MLAGLCDDSSTDPDLVPARILKRSRSSHGVYIGWYPSTKKKKKSRFRGQQLQGMHLTAQLSKVAERLLLPLVEPHVSRTVAFGPNQFANTTGARDTPAYLTMSPHESRRLVLGRVRGFRQSSGRASAGETLKQGTSANTGRFGGFLAAATYCTCGRGWSVL